MNYETPSNQEFSRGLESEVTKCMTYLSKHRPVAVSMANAVRHLKFKINQSKGYELECKNSISNWIDTYIKEQLDTAAEAICQFVREKITTGDVILTYGWCVDRNLHLLYIFLLVKPSIFLIGKSFQVIFNTSNLNIGPQRENKVPSNCSRWKALAGGKGIVEKTCESWDTMHICFCQWAKLHHARSKSS